MQEEVETVKLSKHTATLNFSSGMCIFYNRISQLDDSFRKSKKLTCNKPNFRPRNSLFLVDKMLSLVLPANVMVRAADPENGVKHAKLGMVEIHFHFSRPVTHWNAVILLHHSSKSDA